MRGWLVLIVITFLLSIPTLLATPRWSIPLQTRTASSTFFPCNNPPAEPLFSFWTDVSQNLTYQIQSNVPATNTNLTFSIYRWTPDGNMTKASDLFTCVCDLYKNQTAPQPGNYNLTEYWFDDSQRCDYETERCALVITMSRPDGSRLASCADMLILTHATDHIIKITVTPPAGTTPPAVDVFLTRLFQSYGIAGTKATAGFNANNVYIDPKPFQMRGGSYTVTFTVSDYLDVNIQSNGNRQFRGYYSAERAADILKNAPLDATGIGAVLPGATGVTTSQVTRGAPTSPDEGEENSDVVGAAVFLIVFFGIIFLVFAVAKFFFPDAYKSMTQPCNAKSSKSSA